METLIYIAIFGLALGLVVGMTSIGKGLIGTPGLILLGLSGTTAVGTIGVAGVFMTISSAIKHYKNKNVNMKTVWAFSVTAVPFSFLFAVFKDKINVIIPLTRIIAVVIIMAVITLIYKFFIAKKHYDTYDDSKHSFLLIALIGAVMGFFIGATSISGSLIVIAFMLMLKMPEKLAIGTTNFVSMFSLAAASVGHVTGGHVDIKVLAVFTPAVIIGSYTGAHLTDIIPKKPLQIIIICLLFIAGICVFFNGK